jgi:hypothetical protein
MLKNKVLPVKKPIPQFELSKTVRTFRIKNTIRIR